MCEGELEKDAVVKKFLTTANDGKKYNVLHYNLDAIIAVMLNKEVYEIDK